MEASVIIPARDAAATLGATLAALAAQDTAAAYEVIVIDDGSADDTPAIARAAGARLVAGVGEGPARARNRGAAAAAGRVLAFTDADCIPEPGWLQAALDALEDADLVQGKVLPPEGVAVGPYDRFIAVVSEYGLYETANLVVRRELFERLGGFESILTPRGGGKELGEDVWLGWRARRSGARVAFSDAALVRHAVFPRAPRDYVAEQARVRFFPELVRRIPELRERFLHRRVFLNRRTEKLDLALAGVLLAALAGRRAALLLVLPYARDLRSQRAAAHVQLAADLVTAAALAYGSARARSPVL